MCLLKEVFLLFSFESFVLASYSFILKLRCCHLLFSTRFFKILALSSQIAFKKEKISPYSLK